jgi:ADP-ribosyltransferase exoenzyme
VSDLRHLMDEAYRTIPPDAAKLEEWANAVSTRHGEGGLTTDEVLDIHWYTTNEGYNAMNGLSRSPQNYSVEEAAAIQARIDSATSGLNKLPTYDGTTYRGTNFPDNVLAEWVPGNTVHDRAFWSTSTSADVAEGFRGSGNAFVTIVDGRSGVDVQQLSFYGREAEFLFGRAAPFEVVSRNWNPAGFWEFTVRDAK